MTGLSGLGDVKPYDWGLADRQFGSPLARPSRVFVPVRAIGPSVIDNGGDPICQCFTPDLAQRIAALINADAGLATPGIGG